MSTILLLIGVVTALVLTCGIVSEFVFRGRFGWQDATWRYTLLAIAILPLLVLARTSVPKFSLATNWMTGAQAEARTNETSRKTIAPIATMPERNADLDHNLSTPNNLSAPNGVIEANQAAAASSYPSVPSTPNVATAIPTTAWQSWTLRAITAVWILGMAASLSRLYFAWLAMWRLHRNASPLESSDWLSIAKTISRQVGLQNHPLKLACSNQIASPIVVGVLNPVVLLPDSIVSAEASPNGRQTREILLHEATHIRRRDPAWNLLLQVVVAIWWMHPLIHLLRHRLCWLREILCDGAVATREDPIQYAEALLKMAVNTPLQRTALAIEPPHNALESRVRWILSCPTRAQLTSFHRGFRIGIASVALLLATLILGVQLVPPSTAQPIEVGKAAKASAKVNEKSAEHVTITVGTAIDGIIRLPDGSPAADAIVYLLKQPNGSRTLPTHPQQTKTDADGKFHIDAKKLGKYRIWAETQDYTTLTKKLGGQRLNVKQGGQQSVLLKLHDGCGYDVAVHDAKSGKPIENAEITFGWTDIKRSYKTKQNGMAQIRQLSIDDWYFVIRAEGYGTVFKKTSKQELGSLLPLRFDLEPGGSIKGTLRDEKGNAVADGKIWIDDAELSMTPGYGTVTTDDQGNFEVKGLPIGKWFRVSSDKEKYENARVEIAVTSATTPTNLELISKQRPYGGEIVVSVFDENGLPLAGAEVSNRGNNSADTRKVNTGADGTCRLEDLFERFSGTNIVIRATGFRRLQQTVQTGPKGEPTSVDVHLQRGKALRGRLIKPNGDPAANVQVYYDHGENGDPLGGRVVTDDSGQFEIDGLRDTAVLSVYSPGGFAPIKKRDVVVNVDKELTIRLEVAGLIRVQAVDSETQKRIPEFNVKIGFCEEKKPNDPQPGGISSSLLNPGVDIQGTAQEYRLENQVLGAPFKIIVSAEGYKSRSYPRIVAERSDTAKLMRVKLDRKRAEDYQTVAGRLLDADGKPVAGVAVRLLGGAAIPQSVVTGGGRSFFGFGSPRPVRYKLVGWQTYHWDLLRRDAIENRDQCVQLLKTTSDEQGRFEFKEVDKQTPWLELFYFGDAVMSQRYSNLRDKTERQLTNLTLRAPHSASIRIEIDRTKFPNAGGVTLEAENYMHGPNALKLAHGSENRQLKKGDSVVKFDHLPPGEFTVRLTSKPVELADDGPGAWTSSTLQSQPITASPGEELRVEF